MLRKTKKFLGKLIERVGPPGAVAGLLALVPAVLFLPKIGSLVPTNSVFETLEYLGAGSGSAFYGDMQYAPIRAAEHIASLLSDNVAHLRLVSALVAALAAVCVFLVIKRMSTLRIAVIATLMFITSSWVLHAARFANVEVLNLLVIPALFLVGYLVSTKAHDNKLPISILLLAIILYVPGAWLFLLAGMLVFKSRIKQIWDKVSLKLRISGLGLLAALLSPLIVSFIQRPAAITEWLGINGNNGLDLKEIGSNLLLVPDSLFWSGPDEAVFWLTGTPVLDIFALAMFVIGCFAYRISKNPNNERLVMSALLIGVLLIAVGGSSRLGLLIPIIYIVIGSGIAYMLQSWFTVFPRNPLARSIGLGLIFIAVLASSSYQLQRYFIAWPNSPAIEQLRQ